MGAYCLFLVGPRGSGKSSAGARAAAALGLALHDTDRLVEEDAKMSIADMVAQDGWQAFRLRESRALERAAALGGVISTGGGIVLAEHNRRFMRAAGLVLYLAALPAVLCGRLARNPAPLQRPSLTGAPLLDEVALVLAEREPLYLACAHHVLDASLPLEAVGREIVRLAADGPRAFDNTDAVFSD